MAFFKELFFVFVLLGATLAAPTFLKQLEKDANTEAAKREDVGQELDSIKERLDVLNDATKSLARELEHDIPRNVVKHASKKSSFAEIAREDEAADDAIDQDLQSVLHDTKKEHKPANTGSGMKHDTKKSMDEKKKSAEMQSKVERLKSHLSGLQDSLKTIEKTMKKDDAKEHTAAQTGSGLRDDTYKKSMEKKEPEVTTDEKIENDIEKLTNDLSELKENVNEFQMAFGQKDEPQQKDEKSAKPEFVLHHKDMADTVEDEPEKPKLDSGILETGPARKELLQDLQGDVVETIPEGPKPVSDYDHHVDMADTVAPEEPKEDTEAPDYSKSDDEYIGGPPGTLEDEHAGGPPGGTQDDAVTKKEVAYEEPPPYDDDDEEDVEDIEEAAKKDEQERAAIKAEKEEEELRELYASPVKDVGEEKVGEPKEEVMKADAKVVAHELERASLQAEEDFKNHEEDDKKADEQEILEREADEQERAAIKAEKDLKKQDEEDEKRDEEELRESYASPVKDDGEEKVGEPKEEVVKADDKVVTDDKTFTQNAPDKDAAKEHTESIEESQIQDEQSIEESQIQDELNIIKEKLQGVKAEVEDYKREQLHKKSTNK